MSRIRLDGVDNFGSLGGSFKARSKGGGSQTKRTPNLRPQVAKYIRSRRLIRAALGSCTSDDDEDVDDHAGRGHTDDNRCDSRVNPPEVAGESTAEK